MFNRFIAQLLMISDWEYNANEILKKIKLLYWQNGVSDRDDQG